MVKTDNLVFSNVFVFFLILHRTNYLVHTKTPLKEKLGHLSWRKPGREHRISLLPTDIRSVTKVTLASLEHAPGLDAN